MENIAEIHDRVYQFLSEQYEKDNTFRFTLRQRNRADRLNQGYWFTGNDNYLAFSFWKGDDKRNKTPNIIFVITNDGKSSLEFVSFDEKDKIDFLAEVADALEMQQKKKLNDESYQHWVKNYKGTDYLDSLETFLKRDKRFIDLFVTR